MEQLTFSKVVGFVLAVGFAITIGACLWGLLKGDYMNMALIAEKEQTAHTLRIIFFAAVLSALLTWWCQRFTARRGFLVRMLFALSIFTVAFSCSGALLRSLDSYISRPNQVDWSLLGIYKATYNDFWTFLIGILSAAPAYAALAIAAAIYVALFGPREPKTVEI